MHTLVIVYASTIITFTLAGDLSNYLINPWPPRRRNKKGLHEKNISQYCVPTSFLNVIIALYILNALDRKSFCLPP